jgi:hypothetical protein
MLASVVDVARHRLRRRRGEPSAMQVKAAANDLYRLKSKLSEIRSLVQIDIYDKQPVRLVILPPDPT